MSMPSAYCCTYSYARRTLRVPLRSLSRLLGTSRIPARSSGRLSLLPMRTRLSCSAMRLTRISRPLPSMPAYASLLMTPWVRDVRWPHATQYVVRSASTSVPASLRPQRRNLRTSRLRPSVREGTTGCGYGRVSEAGSPSSMDFRIAPRFPCDAALRDAYRLRKHCKHSFVLGESSPTTSLSQPPSFLRQYEVAPPSNCCPCSSLPRRQALTTSAYTHRPPTPRLQSRSLRLSLSGPVSGIAHGPYRLQSGPPCLPSYLTSQTVLQRTSATPPSPPSTFVRASLWLALEVSITFPHD
ncbi:hypothetical protein K466DRAFT_339515 [Polyporus arcularius HHB13444]|uniref:Uncharacterized protein n=1 Tax=Polyporus arcularius HHB13444 TaxID=1314778 RepID=A0A5C3NWI7_9APHY|nr:hypothetical protein K466DRAFT_339515 [Polyporus arcularius HHB13444]